MILAAFDVPAQYVWAQRLNVLLPTDTPFVGIGVISVIAGMAYNFRDGGMQHFRPCLRSVCAGLSC